MSAEDEVRAVSAKFYAALIKLCGGDPGPMTEVWSRGGGVTTLHPIGGRQVGWDQVGSTYEQVAKVFSGGTVTLADQLIRTHGDVAYEVGVEHVDATMGGQHIRTQVRVTNIYQREGGQWRIVHHHADTWQA